MRMKKIILALFSGIILFELTTFSTYSMLLKEPLLEEPTSEDTSHYRTIDELKKELQEQRKIIEDQKLQQLKEKEKERELQKKPEDKDTDNSIIDKNSDESIKKVEPEKTNEEIPTLIVRLRGKHTTKYLCSYNMIINDHELTKTVFTDYNDLLNKTSLKVRANEIINFQFSKEPKKLRIFKWGEEELQLKNKKGCVRVPDIEEKIVIGVEATYKEGVIRYAVVLDIRK